MMATCVGDITIEGKRYEIRYLPQSFNCFVSPPLGYKYLGITNDPDGKSYVVFQSRSELGEPTTPHLSAPGAAKDNRLVGLNHEGRLPVEQNTTTATKQFDPAKSFWRDDRFDGVNKLAVYSSLGRDALDIIDRFLQGKVTPFQTIESHSASQLLRFQEDFIMLAFFSQSYNFNRILGRAAYDDAKRMKLSSLLYSQYWREDVVTKFDNLSEKGIADYLLMGMSRSDAEDLVDRYQADTLLRWDKPDSGNKIPEELIEITLEGLRAKRQKLNR